MIKIKKSFALAEELHYTSKCGMTYMSYTKYERRS